MDRRMAQGAFGRQLTVPDHVRFDGTIAEERTSPDVRLELTPDIEHKKGRRPARKDCPASQSYDIGAFPIQNCALSRAYTPKSYDCFLSNVVESFQTCTLLVRTP
jgi:hypothetical protein